MAENSKPKDIARNLSIFYETLTEIILKNGGSINKFIGDAVMATFGTPIVDDKHPVYGVKSAIEIISHLSIMNKNLTPPFQINVRIGLNTGTVIAGNIGSSKRVEYAVVGDTVNVASRLERLASPGQILISENTHSRIKDKFKTRYVGTLSLRGKTIKTKVYEIIR